MKWISLIAALVALAGNLPAADTAADFSAANKLYAQGKFSDAAKAYEKLIGSGAVSANVLFNCGNAEFKAGEPGKAIASYRRAGLLAPRNAEVRANLEFVRHQAQGASGGNVWRNGLGQFTLNEWTLITVIAFWLIFILLAVRQIRPALVPRLRGANVILVFVALLAGAGAGVQAMDHFSKSTAVVILPEAVARTGPFDDAQTAFTVRDGAELSVTDRHGDWVQVADGSGKVGWLPLAQVAVLPDA